MIYEAIASSKLDPADCVLEQSNTEFRIIHAVSGSTFRFTVTGAGNADVCQIQSDVTDGHHLKFQAPGEIDSVTPWIISWAAETRTVSDAPDLWAEMQRSRELVRTIQRGDPANTPFTQDEQGEIAAQLRQIKQQLREHPGLTAGQLTEVDSRLDEIAEAGTHMGRKDWLIYVLGSVTALIIASTVLPGIGEQILSTIIHALDHLFSGGHGLPRIPRARA